MQSFILLVVLCCLVLEVCPTIYRMKLQRTGSLRKQLYKSGQLAEFNKLRRRQSRLATGHERFIDYNDNFYLANITIGTPPQEFTIVPDTGSSTLWVISIDCTDQYCRGMTEYKKHRYNPSASSTYHPDGREFKLAYGSGSCNGILGIDKLSFANFYESQTFGIASTIADVFGYQPIDGIMGLAWPALAKQGVIPPVQNLLDQFDYPIFTVYMSRHLDPVEGADGGVITYGGYDPEHCEPEINWVRLTSQTYWQFTLYGVEMGTYKSTDWYQAISDTGTSYLGMPSNIMDNFVHQLDGTYFPYYDSYIVNCSLQQNGPNLRLNINGAFYTIPSMQYVIKFVEETVPYCVFGAFGEDGNGFGPSWILGDVFIRSYCNIHDVRNSRIGFTELKPH